MARIDVDFTGGGKKNVVKETVIPPERAGLKTFINILVTILTAVIAFYFMLPPVNFKAPEFYLYLLIVFCSYIASSAITSKAIVRPEYMPYVKRNSLVPIILIVVVGVIFAGGYISSATLLRAKAYSRILKIEETDFSKSVTVIDSLSGFKNVPMIDAAAAGKLADKTLGDLYLESLESQFEVDYDYSTQINYKQSPVRVFPLRYGDIFKWLSNRAEGLPGYIIVNMNTQKADMVMTEGGIKYSPSEHFGRLLKRHLRFSYPTYIFGQPALEINEDGRPYWICERMDKKVGLLGGDDVVGAVFVDAINGEHKYYDIEEIKSGVSKDGENLSWVDQIYPADLLMKQYNFFGKFSNGFFNSIIGQSGVKLTTDGYNYLALHDDVYMYTGVTSASSDQSIIGFALINQRTKEAFFYQTSGATEKAAMESAEGIVSDKGWKATFPLLLNLDGEATYFMSLKDNNNVIKSYAMVNVSQYSDAVRSPSDDNPDLKACITAYVSKLAARGVHLNIDLTGTAPGGSSGGDTPTQETKEVSGSIAEIRPAVISGNTVYFIRLQNSKTYYTASAADFGSLPVILNVGDYVTITVPMSDAGIVQAKDIKLSVPQTEQAG